MQTEWQQASNVVSIQFGNLSSHHLIQPKSLFHATVHKRHSQLAANDDEFCKYIRKLNVSYNYNMQYIQGQQCHHNRNKNMSMFAIALILHIQSLEPFHLIYQTHGGQPCNAMQTMTHSILAKRINWCTIKSQAHAMPVWDHCEQTQQRQQHQLLQQQQQRHQQQLLIEIASCRSQAHWTLQRNAIENKHCIDMRRFNSVTLRLRRYFCTKTKSLTVWLCSI